MSQRPVRTFLLWLVLGCLLPGIIGAVALLAHEYRQNRAQLERDTLQTARALIQVVDTQILGLQRLGQGLATTDAILIGDLVGFHRRARRSLVAAGLGSTIGLSDRTGQLIVNTRVEFGAPLPMNGSPEVVRRVFETGMPVVSNVFYDALTGNPLMVVGVPVVRDGKVIYTLTVSIDSDQFNKILNAQRLPSGWVATVFDGSGIVFARSRSPEQFAGRKPAEDYLQNLMKSNEGSFDATMKDGVAAFVAHTQSPVTGWRVAVNISEEELSSSLNRQLAALALGIAGLFAIGLGLAHAMSRRIARSFQALVPPAVALGSGAAVSLPHVEIKEAAEVTKAMGEAAQLLKERTSALEAREHDLAERSRALRQSESRLQTLTEHAPAAIAIFDRDMRYLAVSWRWIEDLRLEGKDIIGASHYELIPDIPDAWRQAYRRGLSGEVLRADADRFERSDGQVLWTRWEIWPWRDDSGAVGGIIVAAEDVTERVTAEQQLRHSEYRLGLALKAADTAVWEVHVPTGKILSADNRLFTMLGYEPDALSTLPQWFALMHE
ncbi:MAG TPA: PAS domain S-box protein, partial [Noviherbaspirillum sp.]|nr:PAS domain S-box protein [Noviherbaspirillum sp.]